MATVPVVSTAAQVTAFAIRTFTIYETAVLVRIFLLAVKHTSKSTLAEMVYPESHSRYDDVAVVIFGQH